MSVAVDNLLEELRAVEAFRDLPEDQLTWFLDQAAYHEYAAGDYLSQANEEARNMVVILEGEIQARGEGPQMDGPVFNMPKGSVTGLLPFSRMKIFPMPTRAVHRTRVLTIDKSQFPEMYQTMPDLIPRLVGILTDRVRSSAQQTVQFEKLASLGKLSAGLAHELNNPAAAARQASSTARSLFGCYQELMNDFGQRTFAAEHLEVMRRLETESAAKIEAGETVDTLVSSDREEELAPWLEQLGVFDPWRIGGSLVAAGWTKDSIEGAVCGLPADIRDLAIYRVAAAVEMEQILAQLQASTSRISVLLQAMKEYSYMDRSSMVEVDINQSLDTTLKMFGYRLKKGTEVSTHFDLNLPKICAHGGQLNQVWTNLIDNSLDAMEEHKGRSDPMRLAIHTSFESDSAVVRITDNGPGIPPEVLPRIFDPFFTTKVQGEGTGLGLDMVYRIVQQHHGHIKIDSEPGGTVVTVRLPLTQNDAHPA